jgi:hypothetical protein
MPTIPMAATLKETPMQIRVFRRPRTQMTSVQTICALTVAFVSSSALIAPALGQSTPTLPAPGVSTTVSWSGETFDGVPGLTPSSVPAKKKAKKKAKAPATSAPAAPPTVAETVPASPTTTQLKSQKSKDSSPDSTPTTASAGSGGAANDPDVWAKLRKCESGGSYSINTGNGYYGAYQFALQTWRGLGYSGYPHEASPATQDEAAKKLQARGGWGQWPACSRKLGLR